MGLRIASSYHFRCAWLKHGIYSIWFGIRVASYFRAPFLLYLAGGGEGRGRSDVNENLSVVSGREGHKKEKSWKRKNKIEMGDRA